MSPIRCPRCQMTTSHPRDIWEGYCGRCHDWTSTARALVGQSDDDDFELYMQPLADHSARTMAMYRLDLRSVRGHQMTREQFSRLWPPHGVC